MRFSALSLALHHHTCLPCQRCGAVARKNSGDYRRDCLTTIPRLHQPFQNSTIPLAFRRARACVCLYGFVFALPPRFPYCNRLYALICFHIRTIPCFAPSHLPPLSKGGGLTASHKLSLCCVLLAIHPPF